MHYLDEQTLLSVFDNDRVLIGELMEIFLSDLPRQVAQVEAAIAAGDPHELRSAAHALKGAISNFRAEAVSEQALALELIGRAGSTEGAAEELEKLRPLLGQLKADMLEFMQ